MIHFAFRLFKILLLLFLPFAALIRGGVWLHTRYDLGAYVSIVGGALLTLVVLVVYLTFIQGRLSKQWGDLGAFKNRSMFASVLIIGFCIQGLFFLSPNHLSNPTLKNEVFQLHPILRIAIGTIVFLDKKLIITDASRTPEDYRQMGLPTNQSSLHYRQKDGYSYAVDLRTGQRSELRNLILMQYFRVMGFRAIRHDGTGDHLHISLYCHFR